MVVENGVESMYSLAKSTSLYRMLIAATAIIYEERLCLTYVFQG